VTAQRIARQHRNAYPVSVLSVGTAEGAPIQMVAGAPRAGFLKDARGNLVIPKMDAGSLKDFADLAGGRYSPMTLTDEDLAYLLAEQPLMEDEQFRELERDFDVWFEEGPWLLLLLLPLAALAFRRGWVWSVMLLLMLPGEDAMAFGWEDLWKTPDQQAMEAYEQGDAEAAAALFEDPAWKATANYRSEQFEDAANQFGSIQTSDGQYNLGNAMAKQGRFNEAIEAYEQALALEPENEDAAFNKALIEKLLEQQQQQNDQENQDQENQDQENQDQQDNQQNQDQQDQDEQRQQEQQEKEEQEQDQQQKEQQQEQQAAPEEQEADPLDEEEKQALQQWLRRVPDDPGGLLRRKFQQQYEERLREGKVSGNENTSDW
jgi:Ca-activated chloride channel family protein